MVWCDDGLKEWGVIFVFCIDDYGLGHFSSGVLCLFVSFSFLFDDGSFFLLLLLK
jgi:hypothetical protein